MNRREKRFVMLFISLALILFASFLAAQGPPNPCANACWQTYTSTVKACNGNATCLAAARDAAVKCVHGCGLPPR